MYRVKKDKYHERHGLCCKKSSRLPTKKRIEFCQSCLRDFFTLGKKRDELPEAVQPRLPRYLVGSSTKSQKQVKG